MFQKGSNNICLYCAEFCAFNKNIPVKVNQLGRCRKEQSEIQK